MVVATMWIVPLGFFWPITSQRTFSASGTISLCGAHFRLHWLEHRLVAPKALIQKADQSVLSLFYRKFPICNQLTPQSTVHGWLKAFISLQRASMS